MLDQVLHRLRAEGYAPATLLDVGAHVGSFATGFLSIFPGCAPTLIEPNPFCEEALARLPFERLSAAASSENGKAELFLTKEWLQSTGSSLYRENTAFFRDEVMIRHEVDKVRVDDAFAGRRFDFVKIDTQGSELDVLIGGQQVISQADYVLIEVSLVDYNIGGARAEALFQALDMLGFHPVEVVDFHRLADVADGNLLQIDFLFERRSRRPRAAAAPANNPSTDDTVVALAHSLRLEGRLDASRTVFEHLLGLDPKNPGLLRGLSQVLAAQGLTLEAMDNLQLARAALPDPGLLIDDVRALAAPAIERFNAHLTAGQMEAAERYASALADLAPQSAPMLAAALSCNTALGRLDRARHYAQRLIQVEPENPLAIAALGDLPAANGDPADKALVAARDALSLPADTHPLLRLRDLHDALGMILCTPLTGDREPLARALLAAVKAIPVLGEPGSEWLAWETHYRLLLDAIDLDVAEAPTPSPALLPAAEFADASGQPLDAKAVRALADRLEASCVFFAAADQAYIDLYARWYALSVLKYADVSSLIVVHVIGGAGRLTEVAAKVGIDDPRLVFSADAFDASAVTTLCYDAPPKGLIEKPVAHLQSVRFIRLAELLDIVGRPVFVSDIDLILQRGVADLLERTAGDDLVFNENTHTTSAGARLTANLVLFNPTPMAFRTLAFLRVFLERYLAHEAVTRWIDQAALTMTRHHLWATAPEAKIGYFDSDSDINNVMYRSYQEHPFRFLSLFHGFDTSTLEIEAPASLSEDAPPPAKTKKKAARK
jgi:FkbM family methyltransferase